MDYFLNIRNSKYHHWQADLLLESLIFNKCQEKLLLSISGVDINTDAEFIKNVYRHKRKEAHEDLGLTKGYSDLNKLYNFANAVIFERVTQPVCVLEPHTVLRKEPTVPELNGLYPSFIFSVDPSFTVEQAEHSVGDFFSWSGLGRKEVEDMWIPLGGIYIFNKMPPQVFLQAVDLAESLFVRQTVNNKKVWSRTCDLALVLTIIKNQPHILCRGDYGISGPIDSGTDSFFVSYEHGYLPNFHKSMFTFEPPINLSFGNPIETMSKLEFSPNSSYVAKLARRLLEK